MKFSDHLFIKSFTVLIASLLVSLYIIHSRSDFSAYINLSIVGVVVYSLFTLFIYKLARIYTQHSMDKKYAELIYLNTFVKFVITIIIPVIYYFIYNKPPGFFILPFLLIYIFFTIYSTWLLNKMAVMRK
jgi:hypothetical protein